MTYKVVLVPVVFSGKIDEAAAQYESVLNANAAEGWRLVNIAPVDSANDRVVKTGCFKKEKVTDRYSATALIFEK